MAEISYLLGAGFSVNKGYPTAYSLNKKLVSLRTEDFYIHSSGTVVFLGEGEDDPSLLSGLNDKRFYLDFIDFYIKENDFHYETFYDYYHEMYRTKKYDEVFNDFADSFRKKFRVETDNLNLLSSFNRTFNQLISANLVDGEGKKFYKPIHACGPTYPGYTGILNSLAHFGEKNIVHVHTLNHDIFFEVFGNSDWLYEGKLSDGFTELGSPYYGNLEGGYNVRLPEFTNTYDTTFRLYKLHGSIDQFPFRIQGQGIDTYIKIKLGVGTTELYKEVADENGKLRYINDPFNYHSDFLSGTTSKILRYREPWYYEKVFKHFEENLKASEKLIVVGYGGMDSEINEMIETHFKGKPIHMINPFPNESVNAFCEKLNAKLIVQGLEELDLNELI